MTEKDAYRLQLEFLYKASGSDTHAWGLANKLCFRYGASYIDIADQYYKLLQSNGVTAAEDPAAFIAKLNADKTRVSPVPSPAAFLMTNALERLGIGKLVVVRTIAGEPRFVVAGLDTEFKKLLTTVNEAANHADGSSNEDYFHCLMVDICNDIAPRMPDKVDELRQAAMVDNAPRQRY